MFLEVNNVLVQESLYLRQKQPSMLTLPEFQISNTINRAELTGIASALRAKCTHIPTWPIVLVISDAGTTLTS